MIANVNIRKFTAGTIEDISDEQSRIYEYATKEVVIENPQFLEISDTGDRVTDTSGNEHYIRPGWLRVKMIAKPSAIPAMPAE